MTRKNHTIRAGIAVLCAAALLGPSASCARWRSSRAAPRRNNEAAEAVERAARLREQGLDQVALAELERAIAINPRLTTAYLGIGDIHRTQGNYAEAERGYAKAAEIEPRNFDAQYFHGLTLQMLNRVSDAVKAYLRALTIRPEDFDANLNLATAYLQLGEPGQALLYAQRAVRLRSDSAPARVNLGAVYAAMGNHESAVVEYQQAAELMELTPELLLNLADSLGRVGRHAEMENTLVQLVDMAPSAIAFERLGSARFHLKKYDEALASFRKSLELDANHYPALNGVGVCLLNKFIWSDKTDLESRDEALRALRRSLQIERRQDQIKDLLSRYS